MSIHKIILSYFVVLIAWKSYYVESFFGFGKENQKEYMNMNASDVYDYGVDVSTPIHHYLNKKTHFGKQYYNMISGCYAAYSQRECDSTEQARLQMNLDQPKSQYNYTEMGFKKMKVPEDIWSKIIAYYEENKDKLKPEKWPRGNTYTNNWLSPTYMVSFEDKTLRGGFALKEDIWRALNPIITEWVGKEIEATSLYGIRIYKENAVLATHVDRLPLVSSCIIQVAQNLTKPWPIEVYSHAGKAYNVTMQPGEMVLYESHSVLHGRPFPLEGSLYANIFVHFAPKDYEKMNNLVTGKTKVMPKAAVAKKEDSVGGHEQDNHDHEELQKHLSAFDEAEVRRKRDALAEEEFESEEEEEEDGVKDDRGMDKGNGRTALHEAAARGDLDRLEDLLKDQDSDILHARDVNNWQAIHEATRGNHLDALRYLVDMGADIGAVTKKGGSALWWAKHYFGDDHEIVQYLTDIGAPDIGSEL